MEQIQHTVLNLSKAYILIKHFAEMQGAILYPFSGGENVIIKVIEPFFDKENDRIRRKVNDTFEVTKERGQHLIKRKKAVEVKEPKAAEKKTEKTD